MHAAGKRVSGGGETLDDVNGVSQIEPAPAKA